MYLAVKILLPLNSSAAASFHSVSLNLTDREGTLAGCFLFFGLLFHVRLTSVCVPAGVAVAYRRRIYQLGKDLRPRRAHAVHFCEKT